MTVPKPLGKHYERAFKNTTFLIPLAQSLFTVAHKNNNYAGEGFQWVIISVINANFNISATTFTF